MLVDSLTIAADDLARRTGWHIEPRGACKGDVCIPLPDGAADDGEVDVRAFATALDLPLIEAPELGQWALGPESGRSLTSATAPDLELPTVDGEMFALRSLRGRKVILVAWASW